jgi:hypothetical protein
MNRAILALGLVLARAVQARRPVGEVSLVLLSDGKREAVRFKLQ